MLTLPVNLSFSIPTCFQRNTHTNWIELPKTG